MGVSAGTFYPTNRYIQSDRLSLVEVNDISVIRSVLFEHPFCSAGGTIRLRQIRKDRCRTIELIGGLSDFFNVAK